MTYADDRRGRPARAGQHSDGDVVAESHVAGDARQVAAREPARGAAAAAAAQRAGARGERRGRAARRRCARGWSSTAQNPVCASCHAQMDPLGFALENFDAVGRWRTEDAEAHTPIDASATLPDGSTFTTPGEFRTVLLKRRAEFIQCGRWKRC